MTDVIDAPIVTTTPNGNGNHLSVQRVYDNRELNLTPDAIKQHLVLVQQVMKSVMIDGTHYGKIPGCGDKPTLLKPGAEMLCTLFRLAPSYKITMRQLENLHREYEIVCTLTHVASGFNYGEGVGIASTMEKKYRYRGDSSADTITEVAVPKAYWDAKNSGSDHKAIAAILVKAMGGTAGRYGTKKTDAGWMITIRGESTGEKVENPDLADTYNTVLKIAVKRSLVAATLTATAASDIFAQDLEDLTSDDGPPSPPKTTTPPAPQVDAQALSKFREIISARGHNPDAAVKLLENQVKTRKTSLAALTTDKWQSIHTAAAEGKYDPPRTSAAILKDVEKLLIETFPGVAGKKDAAIDKKRLDTLAAVFPKLAWKQIKELSVEKLEEGFKRMRDMLVNGVDPAPVS